jgi:hypothetical protein
VIFLKSYMFGYIYVLRFTKKQKRHPMIERLIEELDLDLQEKNNSRGTSFISLGDGSDGSNKVRSFKRYEVFDDYLFREIFDVGHRRFKKQFSNDMPMHPGVKVWTADDCDTGVSAAEVFDVVKKRRAMEAGAPSADDSGSALAEFEEFEASVLPALEKIKEDEVCYSPPFPFLHFLIQHSPQEENREREVLEMEESMAKGLVLQAPGGVYFAWSDCLKCMKIGATRREDPQLRLRELSRYVTTPFVLRAWIPTPMPFRLEKQAHAHFSSKRLRGERGVGTEFFRVTDAEAEAYSCAVTGL